VAADLAPDPAAAAVEWRLAVPAAAAWAVTWWGVGAGSGSVAAVGWAALVLGLAGAALAGFRAAAARFPAGFPLRAGVRSRAAVRPAGRDGPPDEDGPLRRHLARALAGAVVVGALVVAAACLALAPRLAHRHDGEVARLAAVGAAVAVELVVTGDPRPAGDRGGVVVPAVTDSVSRRGERSTVAVPVLVVAGPEWADVRWDARYATTGVLSLPRERGDGRAAVLRPRSGPRSLGPPGVPWRAAEHVRSRAREATAPLPAPAPGLLPGLALGDTAGMSEDLTDRMRDAGLAHLSAVSGANVTVVCGGLVALLAWAGAHRRWQVLVGAAALAALVVTARPEPSVLRAAVMGGVGLLGLLAGRPGRAPPALCAAVLLLLAVDPWLSRSFGFALSVSATLGIVVLGRPLAVRLRRALPCPVADPLAVTAAAQAAVTPVLVLLEPVLTPYAVLANLAVGPVVAPTMVLATASAAVSALWVPAGTVLAWPAAAGAGWIAFVAGAAAGAPAARVPWPASPGGALLALAGVVAATAVVAGLTASGPGRRGPTGDVVRGATGRGAGPAARQGPRRLPPRSGTLRTLVAAVGPVVVVVLVAVPVRSSARSWVPEDWAVVVCDVGQGEALLVRAGPEAAVVVDTGPGPAEVTRCLSDAGVRDVPLVVLTHFHADHVGGLAGVLAGRRVGRVWHGPDMAPGAPAALAVARAAGVETARVAPGERADVGRLALTVLWPERVPDPAGAAAGDGTAVNDAGLVVRLDGPALSLLALGDVETAAQVRLAGLAPELLAADVTTIAHHGSRTQVPGLYRRVAPAVAVASAGRDNDYGHPAPETLADVAATGARVAVTAGTGGVAVSAGPPTPAAAGRSTFSAADPVTVRTLRVTTRWRGGRAARRARPSPQAGPRVPEGWQSARVPPARRSSSRRGSSASAGVSPFLAAPAPVVVLSGKDDALADIALRRIRDALAEQDPALEPHRVDSASAGPGDLLEAVTPSLFGGARFVVAAGLEAAAGALAADLLAVAESWQRYADPDLTLVARHAGGVGGKAVLSALTALPGAVTVDCSPPTTERARTDTVHSYARSLGVAVDEDAVAALVTALGQDRAELLAVTRQLCDMGEGRRVTAADVRVLVAGRREARGFDVADALVAGDAADGLALLRHSQLQRVEPVLVIGAIGAKLRTMARVAAAGRGPAAAVAGDLGLPPWQVERAQRDLRKWTPDGLARALVALADADAAVKGEAGAFPAGYALERAALAVMAARRG
jgi:competence protein ComEC